MIEIEVESDEELMQRIQTATEQYPDEVAKAVWQELQMIISSAQTKTPVDTGMLRASGHVEDPLVSPGEIVVRFGFSQNYAEYVESGCPHYANGDEAHHVTGQAHFMQSAMDERINSLGDNIVARIDQLFEGD